MRELEKQATKIAREIENEVIEDIHLAEERGLDLIEDLDQDEEIKYSAVRRDVDSSSFNLQSNAPSTTRAFDLFIRTYNNEQEEFPACSCACSHNSFLRPYCCLRVSSICAPGSPPVQLSLLEVTILTTRLQKTTDKTSINRTLCKKKKPGKMQRIWLNRILVDPRMAATTVIRSRPHSSVPVV